MYAGFKKIHVTWVTGVIAGFLLAVGLEGLHSGQWL